MAVRKTTTGSPKPRRARAQTLEGRELQLIADVVDLTERQIADGTISSQNQNLYLKMASRQYKEELEKARLENELLRKKIEAAGSAQESERLMERAIQAFTSYQGRDEEEQYEG